LRLVIAALWAAENDYGKRHDDQQNGWQPDSLFSGRAVAGVSSGQG